LTIKKVPVIVYESKPKGKFANHGLWLGARTCQSLVAELQVPIGDLRTSTAVTAEVQESVKDAPPSSGMRVNKRRLLEYLASGVDVRWSHQVTAANSSEDGVAVEYREAKDDSKSSTSVVGVVGADGVHSAGKSYNIHDVQAH
jgi:flavin-dependent dehydrogenase